MSKVTAERFHDISCGHRVFGQGGKCENLHGHNYRIHFEVAPMRQDDDASKILEALMRGEVPSTGLDDVGRVLDFGVIKSELCMWIEDNWDHKFLIWESDPWANLLAGVDPTTVWVPFNPTAENMAKHLVDVIGPMKLAKHGCVLIRCKIEETSKCSATYHR